METNRWEKYFVTVDEEEFIVELPDGMQNLATIRINGEELAVEFAPVNGSFLWSLRTPSEGFALALESNQSGITAHAKGWNFDITIEDERKRKIKSLLKVNRQLEGEISFRAPMPGMVQRFLKAAGDPVKIGEPVAILEAMKMENELRSTVTGTIIELVAHSGAPVEKGAILMKIAVEGV